MSSKLKSSLLFSQFAADYAQRWIVNWLEKRSANYKVKPVQLPKRTTPPSSKDQQENQIKDATPEETPQCSLGQVQNSPASRRNSLSQLLDSANQPEQSKTPSFKRRSLGGEALQPSSGIRKETSG